MLSKRLAVIVLILVATNLFLSACGAAATPAAEKPAVQKVETAPTAAQVAPTALGADVAKPAAAAEEPGCGFDVTIGSNADAKMANPLLVIDTDTDGFWRTDLMFDSLIDFDPKTTEPIPRLAKSWEISPDGTTYTFHLVDADVRWHDGQPFTVKDIEFTLMQILKKDYTGQFQPRFKDLVGADKVIKGEATSLEGFKIVDDKTVQFKLNKPSAPFLAMAIKDFKPVPQHLLEGKKITEELPFSQAPVGTGPYKFVKWDKGQRFVMERNDAYWGRKGCPKTITVIAIPDMQALAAAVEAGNIDMTIMAPPTEVPRLAKVAGLAALKQPAIGAEAMWFNMTNPILKDVRVRQAIAMSIDAKAFTENVLLGTTDPANGILSPASWAYDANAKMPEYNPEKAKQLLADAGYPNGFKIKLSTNQGNFFREHFVEYAQAELAKVGIQAEIVKQEWGTFVADVMKGNFDICFQNRKGGIPDPDNIHDFFYTGNANNWQKYSNPEVDKLLDQGQVTVDLAKRKEIYQKVESILNQDLPAYWVFWRPNPVIVKDKYTNVVPAAYHTYAGVRDWHLKQ